MFNLATVMTLVAVLFRQTAPVLLAALGGMFCNRAKSMNIALEGLMLSSAFISISVNALAGNWLIGMLGGILVSVLLALMHAFFTLKYKAHIIIVGFVINTLASSLTIFLMQALYGSSGSYIPEAVDPIPNINIPFVEDIPVLGGLLSGHSVVVWIAILCVFASNILFKRTPYGAHIIAVGENCEAAKSMGINDIAVKYSVFIICGALCGIAGAFFSTGSTLIFVRDMTSGLGFIGIAVMHLGNSRPFGILLASLIYGVSKTVSLQVQTTPGITVPSQFIETIPYVITVIMLVAYALNEMRKKKQVALNK